MRGRGLNEAAISSIFPVGIYKEFRIVVIDFAEKIDIMSIFNTNEIRSARTGAWCQSILVLVDLQLQLSDKRFYSGRNFGGILGGIFISW